MTNDIVKQIKAAWDIVDEIKRHVTLSKRGQNYVGLCPFHNEKTPSFYVSPAKQIFHCFGCGENGDVISFIMKHEHLSFKEVIIEKANELQIPHQFSTDASVSNQMDEIREFLNQLQLKYSEWLTNNPSARDYCKERQVTVEDIQTFGIGYAEKISHQKAWASTHQCQKTGRSSGLFKDDLYPLLSERLTFPIHNSRGILVGFSGRTFDSSNNAKYINSPESALFSKKKLLYGLHLAKKDAKALDQIIVVEGYVDVIAMHRHGFKQTVAVMGTALTNFHAKELAKYTKNIILMFDSDAAGQAAIKKSLPALQQESLTIKICVLEGKDPGDYFLANSASNMSQVIKEAVHYMDYFLVVSQRQFDYSKSTEKSNAVMALGELLKYEKNEVIKEHYIAMISQDVGVSKSVVHSVLNNDKPLADTQVQPSLKTSSKYKKSEDMVLYFLIANLEFRRAHFNECCELIDQLRSIELCEALKNNDSIDYDLVEKISHSEIKKYLLSLIIKFSEVNINYNKKEMEEYLHLLKQGKLNQRVTEIKQLLESENGPEEKKLLTELSELIKKIK